jgi:hypothetical protein
LGLELGALKREVSPWQRCSLREVPLYAAYNGNITTRFQLGLFSFEIRSNISTDNFE